MATKPSPPALPKPIAKLPTAVVNRIAAGEIIQRPANALKELIENALDAGATTIRVTVKEGGVKLLQIQDNGSGIRKSDLPILCERFTTSKIRAFDDLTSLSSYGFRGEALASVSHVAHLTVTTKTRDEPCAWKSAYSDGFMIPLKPGGAAEPSPSAGNDGTVITVEDLFFNTPTRLKSLRSSSEEYSKILAVLMSYSIHNAGISMVCKKVGTTTADIQTSLGASVRDNIGVHYGEGVKRELVEVEVEDDKLGFKADGWFSGANYAGKKGTFLFFINHRLVDCTPLKRAMEAFYQTLLPKGAHPFVYLSLNINPGKVDVNVHPTKREVGFEDQDDIVEVVCNALAKALESHGSSRTFRVQTLLPGAKPVSDQPSSSSSSGDPATSKTRTQSASTSGSRKPAPNKLVRTDQNAQTLHAFLATTTTARAANDDDMDGEDDTEGPPKKRIKQSDHSKEFAEKLEKEAKLVAVRTRIPQSECSLRSIADLRKAVTTGCHRDLDSVIKNHIFVGVADLEGGMSMIQHQTKLYLVNHAALAEELLYQLGLRQFGRFVRIKLEPPPPLKDLVRIALSNEKSHESLKITPEEIVQRIFDRLMQSRAMLDEYFSFTISDNGEIESLPLVLQGHTPNLNMLPHFLIRIGVNVDWFSEKECFDTFLRELAFFYSGTGVSSSDVMGGGLTAREVQHTIFPAAKQYFLPPTTMLKKDFVLVTSLESLYKVFERC
ncbi:putative DNA mismatch repair protein [Meredithblackwellia eburnea MCA 4105]